jgi:hypothetical protein
VVFRKLKRGGQEMYDALDVHGSCSGIPVWMTQPHWKDLGLAEGPHVPLIVLRNLRALLASLRSVSNTPQPQSGDQNDERDQTTDASAASELATKTDQIGVAARVGATAGGVTGATSQKEPR